MHLFMHALANCVFASVETQQRIVGIFEFKPTLLFREERDTALH